MRCKFKNCKEEGKRYIKSKLVCEKHYWEIKRGRPLRIPVWIEPTNI